MICWLLLFLLPNWRVTQFLIRSNVFLLLLATLYTIGVMLVIVQSGFGFVRDFSSAEGVVRLLSIPDFALLVWIHLLCFDLAVGHYIYRDNMKYHYVSLPIQSVILFLTFMFGPFGFLSYIILRTIVKRAKLPREKGIHPDQKQE